MRAALLFPTLSLSMAACGTSQPTTEVVRGNGDRLFSLAAYLGGGAMADPASLRNMAVLTKECMNAAGFEYVPPPATSTPTVGRDTREERESRGFGLSMSGSSSGDDPQQADPNADYVSSLSSEAKQAYFLALNGPVDPRPKYLEDAGCDGSSQAKYLPRIDRVDELNRKLGDLQARLDSDAEVVSIQASYRECMKAAGYNIGTSKDIIDEIYSKLAALSDPANPDALAQIREFERSAALADWDCEDKNYDRLARRSAELEYQFFVDNQTLFVEAMRGKLASPKQDPPP